MKIRLGVGSVFIVSGLVIAVTGLGFYQNERTFMKTALPATGKVIKSEYIKQPFNRKGDAKGLFYPVVAFQTADGKNYEFRSDTGKESPAYTEGEQVEIRYNPQNPADTKIVTFWSNGRILFLFGLFSFAFVWIGFKMNRR